MPFEHFKYFWYSKRLNDFQEKNYQVDKQQLGSLLLTRSIALSIRDNNGQQNV